MTHYSRQVDALHADVNGDLIVMSAETFDYFSLEGVGSRIWELLEPGPITVESITATLIAEFEVDEDTCSQAVTAFLNEAQQSGIVVIHDESR
jgi:hypothetical protein